MNILHVTLGYYPAVSWGGPVKVVHENCKELVHRGHQVTVYCTNLLNKKEKIFPHTSDCFLEGIRVVYFNAWTIPHWPGTLGPVWLPDIHKFLKREIHQFDVVHINGYRNPMILPIVEAARNAGIPIITQPHGMLPIQVSSFWAKRIYDHFFGGEELKGIKALLALQESERQQALRHGISAERIEIIPNGIDPKEASNLPRRGSFRKQFHLDNDRLIVLFLGRINRIKGTDMLVDAFARVKTLDAQLVIAGPDDGQLAQIQQLVRHYQLNSRVIFTGLLSGSDVLAAFQDADLFVLPSRSEAYAMTILEACLIGIPMLITDRCEISGILKGRVAEVVPFDAQAFADGIDHLLSDKELSRSYQWNCKEILNDTFSIDAVVDHLEAIYQRVINENKEK